MPRTDDNTCFNQFKQYFKHKEHIVVFDVGANIELTKIGQLDDFTKHALKAPVPNKTIYAFEPVHFQKFDETYSSNPNVHLITKALDKKSGYAKFYVPPSKGLAGLINRRTFDNIPNIREIEVECITIDDFLEENNIQFVDYLKLDAEGGESRILHGAENSLRQGKIFGGHFECGTTFTDADVHLRDVVQFLNDLGYNCYRHDCNPANNIPAETITENSRDNILFAHRKHVGFEKKSQ